MDLLSRIAEDVIKGLPSEQERLDRALRNLEFYKGDFCRYPSRVATDARDAGRYERTLPVLQRVANVLTSNLYKQGPKRALESAPDAQDWLDDCYRKNHADALLHRADAMGVVSQVAAVQAEPTADPERPVRLRLWDASQLYVWCEPGDAETAAVVGVRDVWNEQRRLRVYDAETVTVYLTREWSKGDTAGATAYYLAVPAKPHGLGRLPFSFAPFDWQIGDFWTGSPGDGLFNVNDCVNFGLTNGFDFTRYNLAPALKLKGTRPGWRPPPHAPGVVWDLPADPNRADEQGAVEPDASYVQADSDFVLANWEDLTRYLDAVLEWHGVPPSAVRMEQTAARSGVSILAEQAELVKWAESRVSLWAKAEDDLARLALAVGARHLGRQTYAGYKATAGALAAAAADPGLRLLWPSLYAEMPGVEQDQADQWELDNRLTSRTLVLMRRSRLTREEAEAHLEEVAKDLEREQTLFKGVTPAPPAQENGREPQADPGGADDGSGGGEATTDESGGQDEG